MYCYHYNTKNESFKKIALFYKEMGVKNYNFVLRLNNPALLYVDPWDPNLDLATQLAIQEEVCNNLWYFVREVVRIPGGGGSNRFKAHRANIAILWAHLLNLNTITVLPRQTNKTTTVMIFYLWDFYFGSVNTKYMLFGYKEKHLKDNMDLFKTLRNALPKYLQLQNPRIDKENVSEIEFNIGDGLKNILTYTVSATSEDKAKLTSRGQSNPRMAYDEVAFINHIRIQYGVAVYAFLNVAKTAKANNSSYGITMMTTTGYLNDDHGRWAYERLQSSAPFNEIPLFDMTYSGLDGMPRFDRDRIVDYIIKNTDGDKEATEFSVFMRIEFMWYELGYTQAWLNEQRSISNGDEDNFRREVLMQWEDATTNHPYGQERIRELQTKIIKPIESLVIDDVFILRFYRTFENESEYNIPFIMGMDSGSNIGNDFSTLVVLDPTNYEVVAVMRANQYSAPKFARAVSYIMENVFTNSILVPERNGLGITTIQIIAETISSPSRRIYSEKVIDVFSDKELVFGVHLTQNLRELFFNDILRNAIVNEMNKIHDEYIIREITKLRFTNKGRVDHQEGEHDDTLFGYLYTRWFLLYASGKERYIDPIIIGSRINKLMGIPLGVLDLYPKLNKENIMEYEMRKVMDLNVDNGEFKSHRQKIQEQMDFINRDIRARALDEKAIEDIARGHDIDYRDIMFRKISKSYDDYKSKEMEDVNGFKFEGDVSSEYSKEVLDNEPEKLKEDLYKKKKYKEMSDEEMRHSLMSIFGR